MRQILVDTVIGFDENKKPITKKVSENIYTIEELPMLGKLLSCKDSTKRGINYLNIPCAFDIETTNIYLRDSEGNILPEPRPYAFMYQWQFCLDDCVCFGRTWEEFEHLIDQLEKRMNLSYSNRLVVYVHNLPFEWAFMRDFINYQDGFWKEERKPLKLLTKEGIEFRCSYALSNMSLNKFCQNEEEVTHYKLVDTYDYNKRRTFKTKLTEEEEAYCYNDVRGLCECIRSRMKSDTLTTMPMTSTGYVRRDLRASVKGDKKYRQMFRDNALTPTLYTMCREAFRGGDTHANIDYSNQLLTSGVSSKDEASAYPATMMMDLFPQTAFFKIKASTFLNRDMSEYALLIEVRFTDIEYKGACGIPYIALSKCRKYSVDKVVDNGRILKASFIECVLTDIDYNIILEEYEIKGDIFLKDIYASRYAPLSDKIKACLMDYYRKKTLLKNNDQAVYEYNKSKNKLNAGYGCCVMRIDQTEVSFNPDTKEYIVKAPDLSETLAKFYKSRNNFLSYQHGVWITAGARKRLRIMLNKVGKDVVYCDTDSIKYLGDHEKDFEERNKEIKEAAIKAGAFAPDSEGNIHYLGYWEDDGYYEEFKTLGAKKYVYKEYNPKKNTHIIKSTIAGVSKKAGADFFNENGVDGFKIGATIKNSGHLTAYYNDEDRHTITVDGATFTTGSNVALIDNNYTIGVTGEYLDLLEKALAKQEDMDYI